MIIKRILDKFHVGIILDSEIIHFHPFSTKWANILNHPEFHYWPLRWSPRCASIVPSLLVSQNGHANVLESSIWIIQSLIIGFTYERNCNSLGWIPTQVFQTIEKSGKKLWETKLLSTCRLFKDNYSMLDTFRDSSDMCYNLLKKNWKIGKIMLNLRMSPSQNSKIPKKTWKTWFQLKIEGRWLIRLTSNLYILPKQNKRINSSKRRFLNTSNLTLDLL